MMSIDSPARSHVAQKNSEIFHLGFWDGKISVTWIRRRAIQRRISKYISKHFDL